MGMISSIVGGAAAIAGAIGGSIASSKANKKAQQLIQDQRDDNRQWFDAKMSQDYTARAENQAVINRQREMLAEVGKNARATNVVAGGSDASEAMQKAAANDAMAQTMSDIASNAANYKDQVEQQFRAQDAALNQQQVQGFQQQAQQAAQAGSQVVNAGLGMVNFTDDEAGKFFGKK